MNITIIGCGNMGSAIVRGLQKNTAHSITISSRNASDLQEFQNAQTTIIDSNITAIKTADVVIIAVKPQVLDQLFSEIKGQLPENSLVISVAAGVTIQRFQEGLKHSAIVRTMPNTPANIGLGTSGWFAPTNISPLQKQQVTEILNSFGTSIEVASEELIDAVTAISGSGPAYFFYFLEHLIKGGVSCGLSKADAKKLALSTALGAVALAEQSADSLAELRQKVTSKGGTTEAALHEMVVQNIGPSIESAVQKAFQRAKEL